MTSFPAVDPIPLPAPVWLFKALHDLTLTLHFGAVHLLLGGLAVAIVLAALASRAGDPDTGRGRAGAAAAIANRLPIVMTYVINLGVPPLLFAQVLYGRALYTSSVLIGLYWILVVFLLILCYWLLYRFAARAGTGGSGWMLGLGAWVVAGVIARIYSTNMTLMLRPEAWQGMYAASGIGAHLPHGDPTLTPRWLFMLAGSLAMGGAGMVWLAGGKDLEPHSRGCLAGLGGRLAAAGAAVQLLLGWWVYRTQPEAVRQALGAQGLCSVWAAIWAGGTVALGAAGAWAGWGSGGLRTQRWLPLGVGVAALAGAVLYRDAIRDGTLKAKGFDVWDRAVAANWSVVGLFVVVLLAGLVAVGWLVWVTMQARPDVEEVSR